MKLLVGLGNPGSKYARQRHNVGFMALDAIIARHAFGPAKRRFQGEAAEGEMGGLKVLALKPQTFMNESGRAVGQAARYYKIGVGDIVVLHDEIDLAAGKVRVKRGGGSAGHNGLKSIAAHLGPDFTRVRIGIGHPGAKEKVQRHVLGDFSRADAGWLEPLLDAIADNAEMLAAGDNANFMNALASAGKPSAAPQPGEKSATPRPGPGKSARKGPRASERPHKPSQRDLARAAARPAPSKPQRRATTGKAGAGASEKSAEGEAPTGPFQLLRRLFGSGQGPDRN